MFKEFSGKVSITRIEENILQLWDGMDVFQQSLKLREDAPPFVFYEGPPTANGRPGIHHVMSRTIKDAVCRYKTMKGYYVSRKAGWDTHGLPVEIEVEKLLGIQGKEEIEQYGVSRFNQKCKESVFAYKKEWDQLTRRIGFWLDLENPYITFDNDYIESVWWILKNFWERGLLYEGFKILPYCPRCETPLSSHEVSLGYRNIKDPSIYVKIRLKETPDTFFLVWTTTPWTLISNVALAVHPDVDYIKVNVNKENLIIAEPRAEAVLGPGYNVVQRYKGRDLEHLAYERVFEFVPVNKKAFYVVLGDFVTTEDGSGIVHSAPAFGEEDYQVGMKYDLPVLRPVDKTGRFEERVTPFKNMFVKQADPHIIADLKNRGILFKEETIEHSYPHCWRCDSPLLYYARESWYVKTSQFKDRMLVNNGKIKWHPPEVGKGRFGEWLKNNVDWALSRDRYWGTPLNIWRCEACQHKMAIESLNELRERSRNDIKDIDLHKPDVDRVEIECPECQDRMRRVPEVIDVWFDSGSMPYAQWHYPFENQDRFRKSFPADFICEGIDQTRGWFYSLLAISTLLFDEPAFKNIVVNELILDKEGQKMSKSRGNVVQPEEIVNRYGVDPLRWYFITGSVPWVPKRFDTRGIEEVYRKFFDTLFNTYSFFALYANIDRFDPKSKTIPVARRPEIDRWILSLLYTTIGKVQKYMDDYDLTRAARSISDFLLNDVSNWYVRRNRRRFWKSEMGEDKLAAYQTLYEILLTLSKLIAPFAPFVSEEIYQDLRTEDMPASVHLTNYPELDEAKESLRDVELEERMRIAQQVVRLARSLRNNVRIKVRQPLSEMQVASQSRSTLKAILKMSDIIKEEINVKTIQVTREIKELVKRRAKPNFKSLGPRVGKLMNRVAEIIKSWDDDMVERIEKEGKIHLSLEGHDITIHAADIEVYEEKSGTMVVGREGNLVVGLDTEITPELEKEGIAREFVNRIQNLRKDSHLEVTDRIEIYYEAPEKIDKALTELAEYIKSETLAVQLQHGLPGKNGSTSITIGSDTFPVRIKRIDN